MVDGAKGTSGDVYVLDTGVTGAERLRLLDSIYGSLSRQLLKDAGLETGKRVLDLACGVGTVSCWMAGEVGPTGSVVATDVNPDQLVVAKAYWTECQNLQPIEFIEASAYDTGLASDSFDIVHCRLLLCHLTKPRNALAEMHRVLKSGGALVSQELRMSSIFCSPELAAYERSVAIALEAGRRLGVNYDYGVQLPRAAIEAGFQLADLQIMHPAYLSGPKKRLWEHSLAEAMPMLVRSDATTETEALDLLTRMRAFAADERTLIGQWANIGILASK